MTDEESEAAAEVMRHTIGANAADTMGIMDAELAEASLAIKIHANEYVERCREAGMNKRQATGFVLGIVLGSLMDLDGPE